MKGRRFTTHFDDRTQFNRYDRIFKEREQTLEGVAVVILCADVKVIFSCFWVQQLPTWRLWGEEKTEGAVYAVYLKKVRYHVPSKAISVSLAAVKRDG